MLVLVAIVLAIGWIGLASTASARLTLGDPRALVVLLIMLAVVHLVLTVDGHRRDQVLLPVVGLLMGFSVLLMSRLPQILLKEAFAIDTPTWEALSLLRQNL